MRFPALIHSFRARLLLLLALMLGADVSGKREKADGHGKQNAENQAEIIEEMRVLLAHGREVYP
jgi:hypothetical protein